MKLLIPKISLDDLSEKEMQVYNNLNSENFGIDLSNKVAEKLTISNSIDKDYTFHTETLVE
ncbi:MAG: hypothetical protein ACI35V_08355 [Sphingobacterium composti]|uniref:hypothetical protein n=1 Tax=Sphingobacterium composti TaxID=363260 RepID=UPI00135CA899|nr:hypothetical protein [Sphingobacterium composti Ten et al. 2007 non Yoo et al. 2007]